MPKTIRESIETILSFQLPNGNTVGSLLSPGEMDDLLSRQSSYGVSEVLAPAINAAGIKDLSSFFRIYGQEFPDIEMGGIDREYVVSGGGFDGLSVKLPISLEWFNYRPYRHVYIADTNGRRHRYNWNHTSQSLTYSPE